MRWHYKFLGSVAVLAGLLLPFALAAPGRAGEPKARQLFVQAVNKDAAFGVTADVDHKDHMYNIGDAVVVTVTSEKDGYLYIFNLDPDNEMTCLFPNNSVMDNGITANTAMTVPSSSKYRISVSEPTGKDIVKVVVCTQPLKTFSLDELNKGLKHKTNFPPIPTKFAKKLFYEAISGDTSGGSQEGTLQEDKNKYQQQNQSQYQEKCKQWACVDIELTTAGKGKPGQDKPGQDKPSQDTGSDKGVKTKPTQDTTTQGKPGQDKPTQGKPGQDTPTQGKPGQDTPVQGKPTQDSGKPSQDKPTQGKPTQDTGKPTQDSGKPTQDSGKPSQDKPTQGKPTQDTGKPSQDKPSQDKPVQKP